jgi:hypothetical protein
MSLQQKVFCEILRVGEILPGILTEFNPSKEGILTPAGFGPFEPERFLNMESSRNSSE